MFLLHLATVACIPHPTLSENVVILIADGLRYEEVFGGADESLANSDQRDAIREYINGSATDRRAALMPFFWHTFATKGQIFGDHTLNSVSEVTNTRNCSYPGYSETMCGYVDPGISCNKPIANPNKTVFEHLNQEPGLAGRVAAFGAWEVISAVFNKNRCHFTDDAAYEPVEDCKLTPEQKELNVEKTTLKHEWAEEATDDVTFRTTLEYVKANHPRVLFVSLGETDRWAHHLRYDNYLNAAHRFDGYVSELWNTMQSIAQYKGKTTFILSCDHGRGAGHDWNTHGSKYSNSKYTWMAFMGPGTRALGEVKNSHVTNGQIAATTAALLGFNYALAQPKAAPIISSVLR
jgi:hypothetical protein